MNLNRELMRTALAAARAGAEVLRRMWGRRVKVERKQRFDFVTEADRAAEEAVLAVIGRRHPDHAVLAEESAGDWSGARRGGEVLWVVDPLDGTTNFIHGYPQVAVSVAATIEGESLAGAVIDVTRGEEFTAWRGGGAFLDGEPIRVSECREMADALLLTGFPFRNQDRLGEYLELFTELFVQVSGVRRAGAAALDLAHVAAGRAEGFWELGLKPWDMAAGALLISEAGGVVTDFDGGPEAIWRGDVAAACPGLHAGLREPCGRHFPGGR